VQQLVINIGFDPEELPHLPVLIGDLQRQSFLFIGERLDLRVKDLDRFYV